MMQNELFGVFGDAELFARHRDPSSFDRVIESDGATVGVTDDALDVPNRTATSADGGDACVVWGEVYTPDGTENPAAWLLNRYRVVGPTALAELNGSYLAFVDVDGTTFVASDPVRSWECYYTDATERRVFGTDPEAVASVVDCPTLQRDQLFEFAHLGFVIGTKTVFEEVNRVPLDSRIGPDTVDELQRFVYQPQEFDYVDELARRLERAIERRAGVPGRAGLLLSGGFDSRTILATNPDIDACYTISEPESREAAVARQLSEQYETPHYTLVPNGSYLNTDWDTVQYAHGIRESLHIHHGGNIDEIALDSVYHGLLFDTFFRGHFLPRDEIGAFGYQLPSTSLDPDPDPVDALIDKFGYIRAAEEYGSTCPPGSDDSKAFVRDRLEQRVDALDDRFESPYDATATVGIENQPTMAFRTHLADHFLESFIAVDAELLAWHLSTPPEYRNTDTLVQAIDQIDPTALRHRPPDRPRESKTLNAIEQFVRSRIPLVDSFAKAWPDRRRHYDEQNLDQTLFPEHPDLHDLPVRLKLRLNDVTQWVNNGDDKSLAAPAVLDPEAQSFNVEK